MINETDEDRTLVITWPYNLDKTSRYRGQYQESSSIPSDSENAILANVVPKSPASYSYSTKKPDPDNPVLLETNTLMMTNLQLNSRFVLTRAS